MLPASAGVSFRPEHFQALMAAELPGLWLELHPENYLAPGGARPRMVDTLASRYPLSLIDVSNLALSAHNIGIDALRWLNQIPTDCVAELHLAGCIDDPLLGSVLRFDSHDGPVSDEHWHLYRAALARTGPRPTLIEWDQRSPSLARLLVEREQAQHWLETGPEA